MKPPMAMILTAVLLADARPMSSQAAADSAVMREIAGCYAVQMGAWDRSLKGDPAAHTPPDAVQLDSILEGGPLGGSGFKLAPHIPALTRYRVVPARWRPVGRDSVRLWWSSGFVGVSMQLVRAGRNLVGTAEAFSDVIPVEVLADGSHRRIPWPAAPVELHRTDCR